MVVYLHSYNLVVKTNIGNKIVINNYGSFFQEFFSAGITRIAVPAFFGISGYLFFFNTKGTFGDFKLKYTKRLKTLLTPFLFWSAWGLLLFFVLQTFPQSKSFFTNKLIKDYSVNELLLTVFINPIPYQFWFIRDLMILVCVSPILYWLLKHIDFFTILIFLITWIFNINFIIFSNEALLFFTLGGYLGLNKKELMNNKSFFNYQIYLLFWIMLVFIKTILIYIAYSNIIVLNLLHKFGILIGLIAIWGLYNRFFQNKNISEYKFYPIFSYSFFIFAFHEPILTILKKIFFFFFGKGELPSLAIYITAPLLTIIISIFIGYSLKRILPRFYAIITGGR